MAIKLKIVYRWMEIADDGLLKYPNKIGPYYDDIDINQPEWGKDGFNSEGKAVDHLTKLHNNPKYQYYMKSEYTLVKFYKTVGVD